MADLGELAAFQKMAGDPRIMRMIDANMAGLERMNPSLAKRVREGDPYAIADAYGAVVSAGEQATKGPRTPAKDAIYEDDYDVIGATLDEHDAIGERLARYERMATERSPVVPQPAEDWSRYDAIGERQTDLPFGEEPTGLIPYGSRGPGATVGGPTGSGVVVPESTALSARVVPRIGIPGPVASPVTDLSTDVLLRRLGTTAGVPVYPQTLARRLSNIDALDDVPVRSADDAVRIVDEVRPLRDRIGDYVNPRTAAAVAGIGAAGAYLGSRMFPLLYGGRPDDEVVPDVTSKPRPFSTADLAAETSPPPSVTTLEEPPLTLADQARQKIRQANEIQLRDGRITPESAALSREADALYQQAAEARRAGREPGIMPVAEQDAMTGFDAIRAGRPVTPAGIEFPAQDSEPTAAEYWQMAEQARAQLNQAHRRGASPHEIAALRSEHRRLLDLYDNRRNRRAG